MTQTSGSIDAMKTLQLPKGLFTIVDDEDFERASKFSWHLNDKGYVVRDSKRGGSREFQYLSRFIMNAPKGVLVDHKQGNLLDNRKSELRFCNHQQNACNRGKQRNNTSGFKGVFWHKRTLKWQVCIRVNLKLIHIGCFDLIESAAAAYADAAKKYHGEFART